MLRCSGEGSRCHARACNVHSSEIMKLPGFKEHLSPETQNSVALFEHLEAKTLLWKYQMTSPEIHEPLTMPALHEAPDVNAPVNVITCTIVDVEIWKIIMMLQQVV
jgi:hypothetical protein